MKTSKKVLAILLTIATLIGIFSCATTVFAEDLNEHAENQAYQENLLTETVESEQEKAEIVCEVTEKRDEYSKTYKRADGSYTSIISQVPLHTYEDGQWNEIDASIEVQEEAGENSGASTYSLRTPTVELPDYDDTIIEDTLILKDSEDSNTQTTNYSNVADAPIANTSSYHSEVLVKFNLDILSFCKNPGVVVTDVSYECSGYVIGNNIVAKPIETPWNSKTVTYSDVYPENNQQAITYENTIIDYFTGVPSQEDASNTTVNINVTDLFTQWINGRENNGFVLMAEDENTSGYLCVAGEGLYPNLSNSSSYITIDYVDTSGNNDSFEYLTQEIGRAGTASVNTLSRSICVSRSDLSMDGLRSPVNAAFNYDPACLTWLELMADVLALEGEELEAPNYFGNNWLPSYCQWISYSISGSDIYFFSGEGAIVCFKETENEDNPNETVYEADESSPSGYSLELIDKDAGYDYENYMVTTPAGDVLHFEENGFVTEIQEAEANSDGSYDKITFEYDESCFKINCVTDGVGRKYVFVYDNESGLLSEIKCLTANDQTIKAGTTNVDLKTTYGYDNNGNLTSVTYPDGETVTYTYENGNLIKAQNIDGYNIQYTYDNLGKVTDIAEYANTTPGNTIALDQLSNRQVKVVDGYNGTETYQFGREGKLHYTFDEKGNYLKSDYAPAKDENVYSSNDWKISSQNLLKNGSFEEVRSAKAVDWSNSFNVEDVEKSGNETDFACRVSSLEESSDTQKQTIAVDGGNSYTFSVYAKNVSAEATPTEKLYISISAKDAEGSKTTQSRCFSLTDEFEQYSITINKETEITSVTVEFGFDETAGDFLVNNAQLEKGNGTALFNYVNNGSFNNSDDNWTTATIVDETLNAKPVKAVKLLGGLPSYNETELEDHISATTQNVKINGKKGETYSIGGWFKGVFDDNYIYENVPTQYTELVEQLTSSSAQIKVTYSYIDEAQQTVTESFAVDFAPHNHGWQYAVDSFALKGDTESIDVTIVAKNIPEASFVTGIELTLNETSYIYENEEEIVEEDAFSGEAPLYYSGNSAENTDECLCEDCEEFNCSCRCASEILCNCVQCKRGTTKEYDNYGNVVSTVKTDGVSTMESETIYSTDGNYLAGAKDENEVISTFTESAENDTALPLQVSVAGRTSDYTFNAGTHLETVNKTVSGLTSGNQMQASYSYDNDRITKVSTNGYSYNFVYDKWGNIATEKVGNQVIANYYYGSNQYNKQLNHILYENGQSVRYGYDSLGNVNAIKYSNDAGWRFTFDYTNSEKTTIIDNVQNYRKEITEKGIIITDLITDQVIYSKSDLTEIFNGAEYTKTINDEVYEQENGTTLQSYVLSGIANSTKTLGFSKLSDWFGRDTKKTVSVNGSAFSIEKEFKYKDGAEQNSTTKYIEEISNSIKINDTVNSAETLRYTYDNHGNVKTVSTSVNDVETTQYEYYYDEANQIVRVDDYINNITTTYQYDMGGNIVSAKEFARENFTVESVALNEDSYVYDSAWKDKISSVNGKAMTYDLIGNLLTYDGKTHTWIAGRKLETFQNSDYSLSFTYDENGLRSSKTVNHNGTNKTVKYTWVDGKLIGQMDGTDILRFIYDDSE